MFLLANISWLEEGPFALYRWEALFQDWRIFGQAFLYTILLSLGAILVAFALGISLAVYQRPKVNFYTQLVVSM